MRASSWLLFGIAALGIAGCGKKQSPIGGQSREFLADRIISLSPSTSEICSLISHPRMLIGHTDSCDYPPSLSNLPSVMKGTTPDYEKIREMKPNLIVFDPALFSDEEEAKIKELAPHVLAFDVHSLQDYEKFLWEHSKMTGAETSASKELDKIWQKVTEAKGVLPKDALSIAVVIGGGQSEYMVAGQNSFQGSLMKEINLDLKGPDSDQFDTINVEQLLQWNPDIILTTEESAKAIVADPRLKSMNAVKDLYVFGTDPGILLRAGSRIDDLLENFIPMADRIWTARKGATN